MADKKQWLILLGSAPYETSRVQNALDLALSAGAMEQPVSLVLMPKAQTLIDAGLETPSSAERDLQKHLASLPMYDIEEIFTLNIKEGLQRHSRLSELRITDINEHQLAAMVSSANTVVNL